MQHRKWQITLKQRMGLCLAAFFAAFAMQLTLNGYQSRAVQAVQDAQMGCFNAISRFQGGVESSISILEAYRWENGETEEMLEKLQAACSTSNAWLWRIRSNMDGLQNVSDEQWVLYGAVETTYGSYNTLLEELESYLSSGQEAKASQLYYNKVSVCGGYLSQYTMQLLKASILDAQTTYTEISELGERIALMQIVVVALCVALGCASGLMVMQLLTPVSQMIEASRAISRSQLDTPDTTKHVLGDTAYCNLQTECVRTAVSEFSRTHNLPNFFAWFDNNGKDKQTSIIDSLQRLGSKLSDLHHKFVGGAKVAKKKSETITDLQKQIADLQAKLAAAQK